VVVGGWHGDLSWAVTIVEATATRGTTKTFHVGILGVLWSGANKGRFETKLERSLALCGLDSIFIDRNHDHLDLRLLQVEAGGLARVTRISNNLPREGRTIITDGLLAGWEGPSRSIANGGQKARTGGPALKKYRNETSKC